MSANYRPITTAAATAPSTPTPVTWYVISQTEVTQPGPQGRLVSGHRIVFGVSTGDTGSVFVPDDQYTVENVQAAIQARVALIVGVGALSGSSPGVRSN